MWKHNNRHRRRNPRPAGLYDNDRTRGGVAFVVVGTWLPKPQERVPGRPSIIIIRDVFVRCGGGMRLHAGGILNYIRLLFFLFMVLFYFFVLLLGLHPSGTWLYFSFVKPQVCGGGYPVHFRQSRLRCYYTIFSFDFHRRCYYRYYYYHYYYFSFSRTRFDRFVPRFLVQIRWIHYWPVTIVVAVCTWLSVSRAYVRVRRRNRPMINEHGVRRLLSFNFIRQAVKPWPIVGITPPSPTLKGYGHRRFLPLCARNGKRRI